MSSDRLPDDDALGVLLGRSRVLEDAPEQLIQRAIDLFAARAAPAQPAQPGLLRRLAATLRFDSATSSPLALGLRSSGEGTRQLLYFSEGRDIDIRVAATDTALGRRWRISGQILGPDAAGTTELRRAGRVERADWNELSEFSFPDVDGGSCTLVLRGADWELELPPIDVPA
jgi:hypothetical protein